MEGARGQQATWNAGEGWDDVIPSQLDRGWEVGARWGHTWFRPGRKRGDRSVQRGVLRRSK